MEAFPAFDAVRKSIIKRRSSLWTITSADLNQLNNETLLSSLRTIKLSDHSLHIPSFKICRFENVFVSIFRSVRRIFVRFRRQTVTNTTNQD